MAEKSVNVYSVLQKLFTQDSLISLDPIKQELKFDAEDIDLYKRLGVVKNEMQDIMQSALGINWERANFYRELDRSYQHPIMAAAGKLWTEVATNYNQLQNASVWATSDSPEYTNVINKFLSFIGMEERIKDWTWNTGWYGDFFCRPIGVPGEGVIHVMDDDHPINVSRADYNGRLIGFFSSPMGEFGQTSSDILSPWDYVHFRLLGAKRKRANYGDPYFTEFKSVSLVSTETRKLSSKYGQSLVGDAVPHYKRLRLAEDSLLIARVSKGSLKYLYKIKVPGNNNAAARSLIDMYGTILKRMRAMNLDPEKANYEDRLGELAQNEDYLIPVFSGDVDDISVEKLGGEVDIRWIRDIDELKNELITALGVPAPLLSGQTKDLPGGMNTNNLEQYSIQFARSTRSLQRAVIAGITRLCQIHLAYLNMNPDSRLFQIHMAETSTAEEEDLKTALDKGIDIADKFTSYVEKCFGEDAVNKEELFNWINHKILKLNDFDLKIVKPSILKGLEEKGIIPKNYFKIMEDQKKLRNEWAVRSTDLRAPLPVTSDKLLETWSWEERYRAKRATINSFKLTESGAYVQKPGVG
jgi:hypothetical protein